MEADAATISDDGMTIGTSAIGWIDVPHFYKNGRVLALYLGRDSELKNVLAVALAKQFAGG